MAHHQPFLSIGAVVFCLVIAVPLTVGVEKATATENETSTPLGSRSIYPLKVSPNGRYLVDQNEAPFLLLGDSPQAIIGNLSVSDAGMYMRNRAHYGVNALWINLLCNDGTACSPDGRTFDGIVPFEIPGDLSTPNPIYFQRVDDMLNLAAANGMVVLLNPIETIGWLNILRANGTERAHEYGVFLGRRYAAFPNIIWMHGNDFQSWRDPTDDALVQAVASGIRTVDHAHIHTVQLNYLTSGSLDDPTWRPLIELNAAYTYYPTYAQILAEYGRPDALPTFLVEANYEFERNPNTDGGSPSNLRRQAYWTMLSGATGQLYGSAFTWRFSANWKANLDTPGIRQLSYMNSLFATCKWYELRPDQAHTVVIAGYGDYAPRGSIAADTYVSAARTDDGGLLMAYLPSARVITVDMAQLSGAVLARWYDPTSGTYQNVSDTLIANVGTRQFDPPDANSAGDSDWVLVLGVPPRPVGPPNQRQRTRLLQ